MLHEVEYRASFKRYAEKNRAVLRERARRYRRERPEEMRESRRKAAARRRALVRDLLRRAKDRPCRDCKQRFPHYVMDFDHVRGKREFFIGKAMAIQVSLARIVAEIEKCDVVCANCHRERTFGARQRKRVWLSRRASPTFSSRPE